MGSILSRADPFEVLVSSALVATTGTSDLAFSLLCVREGGPVTGRVGQDLYWKLSTLTNPRMIFLGCLRAIHNVSSYDFIMDSRSIL
jgi:hypothetical protein